MEYMLYLQNIHGINDIVWNMYTHLNMYIYTLLCNFNNMDKSSSMQFQIACPS